MYHPSEYFGPFIGGTPCNTGSLQWMMDDYMYKWFRNLDGHCATLPDRPAPKGMLNRERDPYEALQAQEYRNAFTS